MLDCLTEGEWTQVTHARIGSPHYFAGYSCRRPVRHGCRQGGSADRLRRLLLWRWEPRRDSCTNVAATPRSVRAVRLKDALAGRRIVFLGDSTVHQQFVSLECLTGDAVDAAASAALCKSVGGCDADETRIGGVQAFALRNGARVTFQRVDYFVDPMQSFNRSEMLSPRLQLSSPFVRAELTSADVVWLSTGAHGHPLIDGNAARIVRIASAVVAHLGANTQERAAIVYRSGVPGYSGCAGRDRPDARLTGYDPSASLYTWGDFATYDSAFARAFHRAQRAANDASAPATRRRFLFFNVTPASMQRVDAHAGPDRTPPDCLHFCLPGPVDEWNHFGLALFDGLPAAGQT
eukprot:4498225-Prymnesium_polylepis.1